ncbi:hypothetical protein EJB05_21329, partial [Eragrostis curvula]
MAVPRWRLNEEEGYAAGWAGLLFAGPSWAGCARGQKNSEEERGGRRGIWCCPGRRGRIPSSHWLAARTAPNAWSRRDKGYLLEYWTYVPVAMHGPEGVAAVCPAAHNAQ